MTQAVNDFDDLFERLTHYADQGVGALGRARDEIRLLKERNQQLEKRVQELEKQLKREDQLKEAVAEQASRTEQTLPTEEDLLPEKEAQAALQSATGEVPSLDRLNPQERLAYWTKHYPQAFTFEQPQPLKIGIHDDLQALEGGDARKIRRALANYVKLPRYLRCLKAGAVRLGLDGNNAGFVTQEEAGHARDQLKRLEEQKKAREQRKKNDRFQSKLQQLAQVHPR